MSDSEKSYWVGLESNPSVLTKFANMLGLPKHLAFSDCFGLDPELLAFVPQPCLAVILLYPYTAMKSFKQAEEEEISNKGQHLSDKLYFMKQLVGNACGTVAVVHTLANIRHKVELESSFLTKFLETSKELDPYKRGELFGKEEGIKKIHHEFASEGQTEAPEADAKLDHHFICFVEVDGALYEFDGGKKFPINHGSTNPESFLNDTAELIKKNWLSKNPDDLHFSIVTLGPIQDN